MEPTAVPDKAPGRPAVDARAKLAAAHAAGATTDEEIAVFHGVEPRTVRRWKAR